MGILDKLFGEKNNDDLMTDDEKELRDYEQNVYMAESAVADGTSSEFVIDDIDFAMNKGTVVSGSVTGGIFSVGDGVKIIRNNEIIFSTEITHINQFGKNSTMRVSEGANAEFVLKDIGKRNRANRSFKKI